MGYAAFIAAFYECVNVHGHVAWCAVDLLGGGAWTCSSRRIRLKYNDRRLISSDLVWSFSAFGAQCIAMQ